MKPYGYVRKDREGLFIYGEHQFQNTMGAELMPVYLHTKEWVGLTDEERSKLVTLHHGWNEYGQAIEQALKEKNT
jgi:hypothetical protein